MSSKGPVGRGKGARAGKRSAAVVRVTKGTLTKAIKAIVRSQAETKYCASNNEVQSQVMQQILFPMNLSPVLPKNGLGVGPYQRIGDQIRGAHGYVDLTFSLLGNDLTSQSWAVKVFQIQSRAIKDGQYIPTAAISNTLLDKGDGVTTDWNPTTVDPLVLSQMPVSDANWTVQSIKTIYLSKNEGGMNSTAPPSASSPNGGHYGSHQTCRLTWKHDAVLKYETDASSTNTVYPTNYCPLYCYVAYRLDGPYTPTVFAPIQVTSRQHMWYTDA